eukprot:5997284-Karenia_brevis.AAC.2
MSRYPCNYGKEYRASCMLWCMISKCSTKLCPYSLLHASSDGVDVHGRCMRDTPARSGSGDGVPHGYAETLPGSMDIKHPSLTLKPDITHEKCLYRCMLCIYSRRAIASTCSAPDEPDCKD